MLMSMNEVKQGLFNPFTFLYEVIKMIKKEFNDYKIDNDDLFTDYSYDSVMFGDDE